MKDDFFDIILAWMMAFIMLLHVQSCARAFAEVPNIPETIFSGSIMKTDKTLLLNLMNVPLRQIGFSTDDKRTSCGRPIVVALVDTGIDYTHPHLQDVLWTNTKEIPNNKIDDDKNGFVDDVIGWDFVHDKPLPFDQHGHGTHLAGIIKITSSYGKINCTRVKIMTLKYYDNSNIGYNNLSNTIKAFNYAVKNGANVINYSGGGYDPSPSEIKEITQGYRKNIFVVAAAGNNSNNLGDVPYYPASYPIASVIGVANFNSENEFSVTSSFGTNVEFAAPGVSIVSLLPDSGFGRLSGTSQSTAFVTGALAFLLSQQPGPIADGIEQVRKKFSKGVLHLPLKSKNKLEWGRLYLPELLN